MPSRLRAPGHPRATRLVTVLAVTLGLAAAVVPAAAEAATPATGTVTVPARVVHDTAYASRWFLTYPTAARATDVVLERVVADTFATTPNATAAQVEPELATLRTALVGGDGDLRRFGPTTPQQVAGAIGVLLASARAHPHSGTTTAAQADVASSLYADYLGGAGDGHADELDEYAGAVTDPTVGDAGVPDSAGAVFGRLEQDALARVLTCAHRAACATVVDWLHQATVGSSVTASAAALAADPAVAGAFSTLGFAVAPDGSASGTPAAATAGALTIVGRVRAATGQITGTTDAGGFHPGEIAVIDALQPSLAAQASDSTARQTSLDTLQSWLAGVAGGWAQIAVQAQVALPLLQFLGGVAGAGLDAIADTVGGAVGVFTGAIDLIGSVADAGGAIGSLGRATIALAEGNIIGAVSDVFGLFGSSQPDPVFQAVQQVQQQVADLQKGMDARFDRVDQQLGDLMTQVQQGLATIDTQHDQLVADFGTTWQQLSAVQASVNRLSQQVTDYFSDGIRASTQSLIDHYDSYRERYGSAMTPAQFSDGESGLYTAATTDAAQAAVAGDFGFAADDVSVARQLGAYPLDKVRTWLDLFHRRFGAMSPAGTAQMVNPDDWARAALGYRQLLDENPKLALPLAGSRQSAVLAAGASVQDALSGLASNPDGTAPLVDATFGDLIGATTALSGALDARADAYLAGHAHGLDAWGGAEQAVNPAIGLDGRCGQPAGSPAAPVDDPSLATRAVPDGLRVAAQAGVTLVAICWSQGGYDELDEQNCHVLKGNLLCESTEDYRRSASVQYSTDGTNWTALTTLTADYGRHTTCRDNLDGSATCYPDSTYLPAWSTATRDAFLASATRVTDPDALGAIEAASNGFLRTLQENTYADVADAVATGAVVMPGGAIDAGADAARAQAGTFVLARAAAVLAATSSASGDQVVRSALWGGPEQLPNNATADGSAAGSLAQRLAAVAANPPATRSGAWSDWLAAGAARAAQVRDRIDADSRALAASGYRDRSVLVATTTARLTAGDATLRQVSWTATPAAVVVPATHVGSSASVTVVLRDTSGGVSLQAGRLTVTGRGRAAWSVASDCPRTLPAGRTCHVTLTFRPTAAGRNGAVLGLPVTPDGVGPTTLSLTGTGTA